jgi:hypothetical protein
LVTAAWQAAAAAQVIKGDMQAKTKPELLKRYIRTGPGEVLRTGRLHRDVKELTDLDVFDSVNIVPMVPAIAAQPATAASDAEHDRTQAITDLEYQLTEKRKFGSFSCQGGATVVSTGLCSNPAYLFMPHCPSCSCCLFLSSALRIASL